MRITFGTRDDAPQADAWPEERRATWWGQDRGRPRQLHTPLGVAFRLGLEPTGQGPWSLVLGAGMAVGLGLWTWRALFALLFPELPELPAYTTAAEPVPVAPPAAAPARPAVSVAPPPAAAEIAPLRRRKPANRLPPVAATPAPAPSPPFDPDATPDMDLTDAPSTAHPPVSLAALPPITPTYLNLNSRPWSEVYMDGQRVGHTPIRNLRVLPGRYTVELVNRQFGMGKRVELVLLPGERVTRSEELQDN